MMLTMDKEIFGTASVVILLVAYLPYYKAIFRHEVKPHIFTWIIWALLTGIGFGVQLYEGEGTGSWMLGTSWILCTGIAVLSLKNGEKTITLSDWISFILALSALPLWYVTKDPFYSVILISLIDGLGYYPTFRKSWHKPYNDSVLFFFLGAVSVLFSLLALGEIIVNTALYPVTIFIMNSVFILLLITRRYFLDNNKGKIHAC